MDQLAEYKAIIRQVFQQYAEWTGGHGITAEMVEDVGGRHFELIRFGRENNTYVHGAILHADLIDGKVWIQYDGTNRPLAEALVEAGIPKDRIVLGFKSPRSRQLTDYAVG
jgi:hypothetical protein